jgi:hypothetical protein
MKPFIFSHGISFLLSLNEGPVIFLQFLDINGDTFSLSDLSGIVNFDLTDVYPANGILSHIKKVFEISIEHPPATSLTSFDGHFLTIINRFFRLGFNHNCGIRAIISERTSKFDCISGE